MSEVLIKFENVWKRFRTGERGTTLRDLLPNAARWLLGREMREQKSRYFWALKDVSFEVRRGEPVGIIGPNGAGKSTTLKILSGITRETRGNVEVKGRVAALIEVGAGFHEDLTGRENAYLNGTIMGLTRRELDAKFDQIIDFAGVRDFIDTPVKRYSTGMKVRLGFAVAAHLDPDVLLIDEVLAVGDASFQRKCLSRMAEYARSDRAVVLVSHNMHHIRTLCKRAILLDRGEVIAQGDTNRVIARYKSLSDELTLTGRRAAKEGSPIRITDVRLLVNGQRRDTIGTGDDLTVEIEYEAREDMPEVGFTIAFYGADGPFRTGYSTGLDFMDVSTRAGRGCVRLTFPEFGIEPGSYAISVGIWDRACFDPYDWHQRAYPLFVEERMPLQGSYRLPHRWDFDGAATFNGQRQPGDEQRPSQREGN